MACSASAQEPIQIGVPVGLSGANSVVAPSVVQSSELAVEEINAAGGILGRQVELVVADDGSGAQGAQRAFDSLVFQDDVDVLISMETSAARNAGLPIVNRAGKPFIYTSFYEGRSCSPWMFVDAWVPEQQVKPIVDHFVDNLSAKTFYLIGSDYNFGRGMLEFTRDYIDGAGRRGARRAVSADGRLRLDRNHQRSEVEQPRRADHLDGRRRAERHPDQAAAQLRRLDSLRQPRRRRGHRQEHGRRRDRHLHLPVLSDRHRQRREQDLPRRHGEEVRQRTEDPERSVRAAVRGDLSLQGRRREGRLGRAAGRSSTPCRRSPSPARAVRSR